MDNIYESLEYISSIAFPNIKQDWSIYSMDDDASLFMVVGWLDSIGTYTNDNYFQAINSLLKIIESEELSPQLKNITEKLTVALATNYINLHSDVVQNKQETAYYFYKNNSIFHSATNLYSQFAYKLISNLITYSLFQLDRELLEILCLKCVSKYRENKVIFKKLIERVKDDFKWNHSISYWVTGENIIQFWELGLLLDSFFPELTFFDTNDGCYILSLKKDADDVDALGLLEKMFDEGVLWTNLEQLPELLEFEYIYPNGKNGDIIKYILEEYGETQQVKPTVWVGKISREYVDLLEMLGPTAKKISTDEAFLTIYDHHIPSIFYNTHMRLYGSKVSSRANFGEIAKKVNLHKNEQRKQRDKVYADLIIANKTSPKWKSEAQLFSIVSNIYPDAIYQYRTEWLGMQSLDVFIPSLSVGIEYQGRQHYKPIKYFGGEKHFEQQQKNDKKKKMLCIENGIRLIEWHYSKEITEDEIKKELNIYSLVTSQTVGNSAIIKEKSVKDSNKKTRCSSSVSKKTNKSKLNKEIRTKISKDKKLEIIDKHINKNITVKSLSQEYCVSVSSISRWISDFKRFGENAIL